MKNYAKRYPDSNRSTSARWGFGFALIVMAVLAFGSLIAYLGHHRPMDSRRLDRVSAPNVDSRVPAPTRADTRQGFSYRKSNLNALHASATTPEARRESVTSPDMGGAESSLKQAPEIPLTSAYAQQLITGLARVSPGPLTSEQVEAVQKKLGELKAQGINAVPAIREFLMRNQDLEFGAAAKVIGYGSLRKALFGDLQELGGSEAVAVSREALQTTADPVEIAILARSLEYMEPGQHRHEALAAVRETLALASGSQAKVGDVAPLFQLMQTYGDSSVIADLQKSLPQWNYYATMTLAGLPEGQGIPALIQLAQTPTAIETGSGRFALQMLAQIAPQYAEAGAALLEQTRSNQLPDAAWKQIAAGLVGDQYEFGKPLPDLVPMAKTYHIEAGNQNFYSTPLRKNRSNSQLEQRLGLIDQLLAANSSPTAAQALQHARATLLARMDSAQGPDQ